MEHPCARQSTKGRTRGEGAGFCFCFFFFFFFPGVAFVLGFLNDFMCFFNHFVFFLPLHELFSLEFRLAQFLFLDFCTPPLKYLMASP